MPWSPDTAADSQSRLLEAIGQEGDLTLVRAGGNLGDELIRAGTHRLLAGRSFREITVDELPAAQGSTVLLPGSGAWCRPYHEWMPHALAVAELRFDRVIVLPSSFDPGEDSVRRALERTRALVFAREAESLQRIQSLCQAELAHDCAFFFDYSPWMGPGEGTLNAFRTDPEARPGELPADNRDISLEAQSLADWLAIIAAHAVIRTDRAHVMIAAALMGKSVQAAPSRYHKVPALAETWLRDYPVELDVPIDPVQPAPDSRHRQTGAGRVTAVLVTRDRPDRLRRAVRSVAGSSEIASIVVLDNNSDPLGEPQLAELAVQDERVVVYRSERDLGRSGGQRAALDLVTTELVLLLDDDVAVTPGAVERLVGELEAAPAAAGATALVIAPDGLISHYGGEVVVGDAAACFGLDGTGNRVDELELPASGPTGWLPSGCSLVRASVLRDIPLDAQMVPRYEDAEWSFRVRRAGLSFRRCSGAVAIRYPTAPSGPPSSRLTAAVARVEPLVPMARFLDRHGMLLGFEPADLLPELRLPGGGTDLQGLRRLLELVSTRGVDWTVMEWLNGGLDPLWTGHRSASSDSARERRRGHLLTRGLRLRCFDDDLDGA